MSLSWLLEDEPEQDIVLLPKKKRQAKVGDEHMGYSYELLANRSPFSRVEPTLVHVTPKDANLREEMYTHSHDEFIFVLKGKIQLSYDGELYDMEEGDTAYFKGTKPHLFIPVDNEGAEVLTLFIETDE